MGVLVGGAWSGWRWVDGEGMRLLEGSIGQRCATTAEAYDYEFAAMRSCEGEKDARDQLSFLQKFLNQCCSETSVHEEGSEADQTRQVITTSPLEDWL